MIRRSGATSAAPAADNEQMLRLIAEVCRAAAAGDLEARLPSLGASEQAIAARTALNGLLDNTDAFVREAGAALEAAPRAGSTGAS